MTDPPAAAVTAAAEAITARFTAEHGVPPDAEERLLIGRLARAAAEAAAPHLAAAAAAAERKRIIELASQMRAAIPADHPEGAQASFADYLCVMFEAAP